VEYHPCDEDRSPSPTYARRPFETVAGRGEMKMYEHLKIESTSKILSSDLLAKSEVFPNTEVIYGKGLWQIPVDVLDEAEKCLGYRFPAMLRQFYLEVGVGRIPSYRHAANNSPNNILIPTHIPKLIDGTCEWMMPYTTIEPNTLPFFERDVDLFLCLHPKSENPNAVFWMWGENMPNAGKVCDSLIDFFERLVKDPNWFNPSKA
jgi:hypothetical protein